MLSMCYPCNFHVFHSLRLREALHPREFQLKRHPIVSLFIKHASHPSRHDSPLTQYLFSSVVLRRVPKRAPLDDG